ncbi:MAG: FUSC family protein [Candidatus Binataceae bacterium]
MAATPYPTAHHAPRSRGPLDALLTLLGEELALRPHRLRSALRSATIGAVGAGLMAAAHVDTPLGPYLVWLLAGTPTAMMAWRTAVSFTVIEGAALGVAVVLAWVLSQSPVLMLAALGLFAALSTDLIVRFKLGSIGLITQVLVIDTFYGVMFAPGQVGWNSAYTFGGIAIACGIIALTDNWLWPDPAEAILLEALADVLRRIRRRLLVSTSCYLAADPASAAHLRSDPHALTPYLELLQRAQAEGLSAHRRGVLGAALTRAARLQTRVAQIVVDARANVPRDARRLLAPQTAATIAAIAAALDELAGDPVLMLRAGPDEPPSPAAARMRSAITALDAEAAATLPAHLDRIGAAERANLNDFYTAIRAIGRLLERPLDESTVAARAPAPAATASASPDAAHVHYCLKVAIAIVAGYVIGLTSQRPDLSTIMTTVIITALPTYGAAVRKMILRLVGGILGGVLIVMLIVIVSPNFETLPSYVIAIFLVLVVSGYTGEGSGRIAYAGKQLGTTFLLAFAGLSPSVAVEAPLWRVWGIILGTVVVLLVSLLLWPDYAGDALPPRLRQLLRLTIALAPGAAADEAAMQRLDTELNGVLEQTLAIADDARFEGRASRLNPDAVVQTAGTLRRIAHRFEMIARGRSVDPRPTLDPVAERAMRTVLDGVLAELRNWLTWSERPVDAIGPESPPQATGQSAVTQALAELTSRIEADGFAQIAGWSSEERRSLFAELESMRRLTFLIGELNEYLSHVHRWNSVYLK